MLVRFMAAFAFGLLMMSFFGCSAPQPHVNGMTEQVILQARQVDALEGCPDGTHTKEIEHQGSTTLNDVFVIETAWMATNDNIASIEVNLREGRDNVKYILVQNEHGELGDTTHGRYGTDFFRISESTPNVFVINTKKTFNGVTPTGKIYVCYTT